MLDLEVRIVRLEEALRDARRLAQAALEMASRALQQSHTLGGGFSGSQTALIWGRAVGPIGPRIGATLGTGTVHLASAPSGVLVEGVNSRAVLNALPFEIGDDVWVGMLEDDRNQLVVVLVSDPCDGLTEP